jgi:hypothetical protein
MVRTEAKVLRRELMVKTKASPRRELMVRTEAKVRDAS